MKRASRRKLEVVSKDNCFLFRTLNGPELLIQAVEKHPCLWDNKSDCHSKKEERDAAWIKVCEVVFADWHLMEENEKCNKSADLKKKWTHIRDYYRKDIMRIKKLPPGTDMRKQKRYVFSDMLHFLEPLYDANSRNTESRDTLESDSTTLEETEFEEAFYYDDEDEKYSIGQLPQAASTSGEALRRKAGVPSTPFYGNQPETVTSEESSVENDDTKFLLSLRGDLKQLNHSQKLDFKIGVLQLIQKIMYSKEQTNPAKKQKLSNTAVESEPDHVMSTVLKMSPVFVNENSHESFDSNGYFTAAGKN